MSSHLCQGCKKSRPRKDFSNCRLKGPWKDRFCKTCVQAGIQLLSPELRLGGTQQAARTLFYSWIVNHRILTRNLQLLLVALKCNLRVMTMLPHLLEKGALSLHLCLVAFWLAPVSEWTVVVVCNLNIFKNIAHKYFSCPWLVFVGRSYPNNSSQGSALTMLSWP